MNARQKAAFRAAADRWTGVIVGDLPSVQVEGEVIDDVLILAQGAAIDGPGKILGQAGPTHIRPASAGAAAFLPAKGIMSFDTADLANMDAARTLNIIRPPPNRFTHELLADEPYRLDRSEDAGEPDGVFPAGTPVVLLVEGPDSCRVVDGDGLYVEVRRESLRKLPDA